MGEVVERKTMQHKRGRYKGEAGGGVRNEVLGWKGMQESHNNNPNRHSYTHKYTTRTKETSFGCC